VWGDRFKLQNLQSIYYTCVLGIVQMIHGYPSITISGSRSNLQNSDEEIREKSTLYHNLSFLG
jgi:hypothetical protein